MQPMYQLMSTLARLKTTPSAEAAATPPS